MTKLLYAVQGTGNGHITKARILGPKLKAVGFDVDFLFSGRNADEYFDMEVFGDYQIKQGLTFQVEGGNVLYLKTLLNSHPARFIREVKSLDLKGYDLVLSDYEPVTAWAAQQQGIPVVGIGHQYAFKYQIPMAGDTRLTRAIMRHFAPVNIGFGLHWHHFGQPILPPIVQIPELPARNDPQKILVYLPFENIETVLALLENLRFHQFHVFHPHTQGVEAKPHIELHPLSRSVMQHHFADCYGVITNSGFEMSSEALQAGKRILTKPLQGQFEQQSNALALRMLGLGTAVDHLDERSIAHWLRNSRALRVQYPDTAQAVAERLISGQLSLDQDWLDSLWSQVSWGGSKMPSWNVAA